MCHGCQVVRISAVVLLALSLGIVNCDYSEAEQFAPAQTAAKTEAHTISDYFMDDVDDISYFEQTNIHDLYNAITEQHSKTNELSSEVEELAHRLREHIHKTKKQKASIQELHSLLEDIYTEEIWPTSEQVRYIDDYLSRMSKSVRTDFQQKDEQIDDINHNLFRLETSFEDISREIQKLSDELSHGSPGSDSQSSHSQSSHSQSSHSQSSHSQSSHSQTGSQVHDNTADRLDLLEHQIQSHSEQLKKITSHLINLDGELKDDRDEMQKISSDLDQIKHEFKPYNLKIRVLSDNVISLSQQLQVTSDILEKHLAEEAGAPPPSRRPGTVRDCSDLPAGARSGVHLLQTGLAGPQKVAALCDLDTDGGRWTVIQRRDDIEPRENFYRNWTAYRAGFGRLDGEFWWGLDKMSALSGATDRSYELRVNLEDFEGRRRHAVYGEFSIAPESDGYRLHVSNYSGDAGDSLSAHSGHRFTTYDRDHDPYAGNCARSHRGGWWYHEKCLQSNLNGVYFKKYRADNTRGITWTTFHNSFYSLKTVTMKIRPT